MNRIGGGGGGRSAADGDQGAGTEKAIGIDAICTDGGANVVEKNPGDQINRELPVSSDRDGGRRSTRSGRRTTKQGDARGR